MAISLQQPRASIIGAGLAGLSAAIALRRAGWHCTLFERSSFKNEIGAAITVNPSVVRCLTHWDFDFERAGPTNNVEMIVRKAGDMTMLAEVEYPDLEQVWGFKSLFFHRVDLHRGLLECATQEKGQGTPAIVELGKKVVGLDCEGGIVRFADGKEVKSDLVIVADGVHVSL